MKRTWHSYNKQKLLDKLSMANFDIKTDDVQSTWNNFEKQLLPIIDKLVPIVPFQNCSSSKSLHPPANIKSKVNLRKRLLKSLRNNPSNSLRDRIKKT